jgi:hypothetical protein
MANPRPGKRRVADGEGPSRARVAPTRRTTQPDPDERPSSHHRPWVQIVVWIVVAAMVLSGLSVLVSAVLL